MSGLGDILKEDFKDKETRDIYCGEFLNSSIATQIKVLREQRNLTQKELATLAGMKQSRIATIEDVNYSSWSIKTLKRIAEAFDLALTVQFDSFGSKLFDIINLQRDTLARPSFDDDPVFQEELGTQYNITVSGEPIESPTFIDRREDVLTTDDETLEILPFYTEVIGAFATMATISDQHNNRLLRLAT